MTAELPAIREHARAMRDALRHHHAISAPWVNVNSAIEQRRKMVHDRRDRISHQIAELELARDYMDHRCWFYDVASESGTTEIPSNMPPDEMPPKIRTIRRECHINRY